jgi:hypothetical protein
MRISPRVTPLRRIARRSAFSHSSRLGWTMLRMISLNSLAAFTQEVTRSAGIQPVRGADRPQDAARAAAPPPQRTLDAAPPSGSPPPLQILPRGSLLDLRV